MAKLNQDLYVLYLQSLIYCDVGGKHISTSNNSITISKSEQKIVFKFRSVKGSNLKSFTICTINTPLFEGILYVSDYRGGELEAYNQDFIDNVNVRLKEILDFGFETFVDTSEYVHRTRFSRDIQLEKHRAYLQRLSDEKQKKY